MHAFLIRNGLVADGSGAPLRRADVAVQGDRIAAVGEALGAAESVIDANGQVVAPGFIDIHTHTDKTIFSHPLAESKVLQGVTTDVTGNCGVSAFPGDPRRREALADTLRMYSFIIPSEGMAWSTFREYADALDRAGLGINLVPLVGHGTLRMVTMGAEDRPASPDELHAMEQLLGEALEQGAWGLSTGLIYPPSSFAGTEELIALARVLARYGAIYTSHIRGESATLMEAIGEAIRIGRESGARIEVSHLKALGRAFWGKGREALARIEQARREGVDIAADQYPYSASSTTLAALVPAWAKDGGAGEMLKRLAAAASRARLIEDIRREMSVRGGPDQVLVVGGVASERNRGVIGKTVLEIASLWNIGPEEAVVRLLIEEEARVRAVFFSISEDEIVSIMQSPLVAIGSDGMAMHAMADAAESTHPRSYGTFARVLGLYARERKVLNLETAVHKMTGLPASRLGLNDRGFIRPGLAADLTLFDPARISDRSRFDAPHQYAAGVCHVFVNGCPVVAEGEVTGRTPGRVLRKPRAS